MGVLVVGHGTRNVSGAEQFRELARQIQELLPRTVVEGCFLELSEPDIAMGVRSLRQRGCEQLCVVPVLLFTAGHAKSDIPDAVRESCEREGMGFLGQTSSLGTHPLVVELSAERFRQVIAMESDVCAKGCCAFGSDPRLRCELHQREPNTCELGKWLDESQKDSSKGQRVALAMVGRGTSDEEALSHMRRLTAIRTKLTPVAWVETGFFAGGKPSVDELLEGALGSGCEVVVVQPHLLFEGELMDKLREKVRTIRGRSMSQSWWMTGSLGADPQLARVFVGLLREMVDSKVLDLQRRGKALEF
jgi:sirohydrochlorin cobaltochelatase